MRQALITGTGSYLPEKVLTNTDLTRFMDTDDAWIRQRTGIEKRHVVAKDEMTSDLAIKAARPALEAAGVEPDDLDAIIIATTTPDDTFPATAVKVQAGLGASKAFAFDVQAVCAGFVFALDTADAYIKSGKADKVLVIGAESFTRILDWEDRTTAVLFGDGAGAVVLEASESSPDWGVLSSALFSDGRYRDILYVDGGVSSTGDVGHVRMKGNEVFRHAVEKLSAGLLAALDRSDLTAQDIDWLVPHQANIRIIDSMQKKFGFAAEKVIRTVHDHANTSAASIPLALDAAVRDGRITNGHVIAFEAIGGGLSWGAALARFGRP
ncbi:MAG: beta-ketoacyl-ACP synthase III [Candidatus Puniceispirillales bacterium]